VWGGSKRAVRRRRKAYIGVFGKNLREVGQDTGPWAGSRELKGDPAT